MNLENFENEIEYKFKNINLLKNAFTHTSYANENKTKSNEKLEFLGDAILEFTVSEYLYKNYSNLNEGEMTKVRATYVCENANYQYAVDLNLTDYILVGHGELKDGKDFKKAIVADIFEALMGAIYIDLGYATVRRVVLDIIVPYIENPDVNFFNDYKSCLQEFVQTVQRSLEYNLIKEEGPAHEKKFTMNVVIDNIVYGVGEGPSKKEAEQEAAKIALEKLAIKK